jgi:hypothetical protein
MPEWVTLVLSIVGSILAGGGVSWFLLNATKRKTIAEASKSEAEARSTESDVPGKIVGAAGDLATQAMAMVRQQQEQVASLQKDMEGMVALKQENKDLRADVEHMKKDLRLVHRELAEFRRGCRILIQQMKERDIIPLWVPPKRRLPETVASDTALDTEGSRFDNTG